MLRFRFCLFLLVLLAGTQLTAQNHQRYIKGEFSEPQDVTRECMRCHSNEGDDVLKTNHWLWLNESYTDENGNTLQTGKKNLINNFCIAVTSNYPRCTSCHIGYGWKDSSFDFTKKDNIDCLVCHDRTGTYKKSPTGAGMPEPTVDLLYVAKNVGKPTRQNCGSCHFDGGGGTGVKHGDMDNTLYQPTKEQDVHMGGLDFQCTDCHTTKNHSIMGASHGSIAAGENHIYCTNCHEQSLHKNPILNNHTKSVACETCHIAAFARTEPTKMWWDWSTAGSDTEKPKDEFGKETYSKMKGDFTWAKNVTPAYYWYNGKADYYAAGEVFDPAKPVKLNTLSGSKADTTAKITPFKLMRGKQIYDTVNNYLIIPKLFGENGYWKVFDWNTASIEGMKEANLPYSGKYGFIETEMAWPINHTVAPKEQALKCTDCHGVNGRLDWASLGYASDPMKTGGRFKKQ